MFSLFRSSLFALIFAIAAVSYAQQPAGEAGRQQALALCEKAQKYLDEKFPEKTAPPGIYQLAVDHVHGLYAQAIAADPSCADAYLGRARFEFHTTNQYEAARKDALKAIELAPSRSDLRRFMVDLATYLEEPELAVEHAETGYKLRKAELIRSPADSEARETILVDFALKTGRWEEVIQLCDENLKRIAARREKAPDVENNDSPELTERQELMFEAEEVRQVRALALYALGRDEEADAESKDFSSFFKAKVFAYRAKNAKLTVAPLLELARKSGPIEEWRAGGVFAKLDLVAAPWGARDEIPIKISLYDRAIEKSPKMAEAYFERGELRADLARYLRESSADGLTAVNLKRRWAELSALEKTIADYDAAERLGVEKRKTSAARGWCYKVHGKLRPALAEYEKAFDAAGPDDAVPIADALQVSRELMDDEKTLALLDWFIARRKDKGGADDSYHRERAKLLEKLGRSE